jgi:hypothetical protein
LRQGKRKREEKEEKKFHRSPIATALDHREEDHAKFPKLSWNVEFDH